MLEGRLVLIVTITQIPCECLQGAILGVAGIGEADRTPKAHIRHFLGEGSDRLGVDGIEYDGRVVYTARRRSHL